MNPKWICIIGIGLLVTGSGAQQPVVLDTKTDKVSYSIGADLAKNLKQQGVSVNPEALAQGLKDAFAGGSMLMSAADMEKTLNFVKTEIRQRQLMAPKLAGDENRAAGEAFLAENKKKPGVVTLPSGLQYRVLQAGSGPKPTGADTVECIYRGTLPNGSEFDSSPKDGKPVEMNLRKTIPGLREALELMPAGSKWQIVIPAQLAYRSWGKPPTVGPYSAVIFEVELVSLK